MKGPKQDVWARENRAVSPVIGVILMVAITVILAAVIGAFVLEIGDQQETAPNSSFESQQEIRYHQGDPGDPTRSMNLTNVFISHAGGDIVTVSQTNIVIEGNSSVWGVAKMRNPKRDLAQPVPDVTRVLGTNEVMKFQSGSTWPILGYGNSGFGGGFPSDENVKAYNTQEASGKYYLMAYPAHIGWENPMLQYGDDSAGSISNVGRGHRLQTGDKINVIWQSESGGKTQALFKYTVQ